MADCRAHDSRQCCRFFASPKCVMKKISIEKSVLYFLKSWNSSSQIFNNRLSRFKIIFVSFPKDTSNLI